MDIRDVCFFLTDRCTAACPVCFAQCSPDRKFVMDKNLIKRYMREAKELGTVKTFDFSGGEPLLYPELLLETARYGMEECGIPFAIVTNGFWGKDIDYARKLMKKLVDAGIKGMRLSVDAFHQQFVPPQSVKNALIAISEVGLRPELSIMDTKDRSGIVKTIESLRPEIYLADDVIYYPVVLPELAANSTRHGLTDDDVIKTFDVKNATCIGVESINIYFDGKMYPCCSQFSFEIPGICLGTAGETSLKEAVERMNRSPVLDMMKRCDLKWFVKEAESLGIKFKECYSMDCEICRDLLNNPVFMEHIEKRAKEESQKMRVAKFLGKG